MPYGETKVYFDGSHYIAIPHTTRPSKKRLPPIEEEITVYEDSPEQEAAGTSSEDTEDVSATLTEDAAATAADSPEDATEKPQETVTGKNRVGRKMTRKELFEQLYKETQNKRRAERKRMITEGMRPYFKSDEETALFVNSQMERKQRNMISRRIRMCRKANLKEFNYFCTFTYDGKLHTEDSFKYKLKHTLSNFAKRKEWKYIGVWERSPKTDRLHFHGIFYIPEGTMPGKFIQVEDYNFNTYRRQITNQSIYFNERFGRSDFEPIDDKSRMGEAMAYLMKYIEKSGEKIVYSKGLPQYFISDILDDDVVCMVGMEEQKLLLFDNFSCWDEGVYIGEVSPAVIKQLRKANN